MPGWLKLFYRFKEWQWYSDINMVRLFIHLLLSANYKELKWCECVIPRGSLITSRAQLASQTKLSEREVRTCLARLERTNEIAIETTNRYTIITIKNYERYQDNCDGVDQEYDQPQDQRTTSERPTSDQQTTTSKEYKNKRKEEIKNKSTSSSLRSDDGSDFGSDSESFKIDEKGFIEFFNSEMLRQSAIIPRITSLGKSRRTHLAARCREHGKEALATMVRKAARSDFLNGQNSRGWKATFDWLILPTNFPKVLEGAYDNHISNQSQIHSYDATTNNRQFDETARRRQEFREHIMQKLNAPPRPEPDISDLI